MEFFFGIFENDPKSNLPELDDEKLELEECLRPLEIAGQLAISMDTNIGLNVMLDKLRDYQNVITIFHFSGHHSTDYIKTNDSELDDDDLITFLNNCPKLKLVFINGCSSAPILDRLNNIPIKIGTNEDVYDIYAKEFAVQFYKNIFSGDSIDGIKERQKILESFDLSLNTSFNLLGEESKVEVSAKRGGGSPDELATETFKISTASDENGAMFKERNADVFDKENVNINEEFELFVNNSKYKGVSIKKGLGLSQAFKIYRHYPYNISIALMKILSHDEDANGFNVDRFNATKELFREYFNLIRVVALASIWNSYVQEIISPEDNEKIGDLLYIDHSELTLEDFLQSLFEMVKILPSEYLNTKIVIKQLIENFNKQNSFLVRAAEFLEEAPEDNESASDYHKIYKTSILVQGFILRFGLLRNLCYCSITKFEFKNYKTIFKKEFTYTALTFPTRTRPGNSKPKVLKVTDTDNNDNGILDNSKLDIKDQNSVYLMFKDDKESSYILNLSPFLFDANSENDDSDMMDLKYILNYSDEYSDWTFTEANVKDDSKWLENLEGQKLIKNELNVIVESFLE